MEILLDGMRAE